jgi:hypothetical protein
VPSPPPPRSVLSNLTSLCPRSFPIKNRQPAALIPHEAHSNSCADVDIKCRGNRITDDVISVIWGRGGANIPDRLRTRKQ